MGSADKNVRRERGAQPEGAVGNIQTETHRWLTARCMAEELDGFGSKIKVQARETARL